MELRDAFTSRKNRFRLLDKALTLAGVDKSAPLLEVGCAGGDGAAHLAALGYERVTGVDIDAAVIELARQAHPAARFVCADARELPFGDGEFAAVVSEAAFSVIPGKAAAAAEYARVLAPGGLVLLDDFAALTGEEHPRPGIPCLDGVQSMTRYKEIFTSAGFVPVYEKEEYGEYIGITMSLCKAYGVSPQEVGRYIVSAFGSDGYVTDFFSHTRLTYCQMIFKRV